MGFQFRKRIKILPGLHLNLSKSGVSASSGVRGARVSFSRKGTTRTLGIPGTGLFHTSRCSWKSLSGDPGRHVPPEAARRYYYDQEQDLPCVHIATRGRSGDDVAREINHTLLRKRQQARLEVESSDQLKAIYNDVIRKNDAVRFEDPDTGRKKSNREIEGAIRRLELHEKVEANEERIKADEDALIEFAQFWRDLPDVPIWDEYSTALDRLPHVASETAPVVDWDREQKNLYRTLKNEVRRSKWYMRIAPAFMIRKRAKEAFPTRWHSREEQLRRELADRHQAFEDRMRIEREEHEKVDDARIARLRALMVGDSPAIQLAVEEVIEGVGFPFETSCDLAFNETTWLYINLDLPEIEDTIPENRMRALKNGTVKSERRPANQRNQYYYELVLGQSILMAASMLSALPTLFNVTVAGYTQRKGKDCYVFDVTYTRDALREFRPDENGIDWLIASLGGRIEASNTLHLKRISEPKWIS